jgi:hypothetical protein
MQKLRKFNQGASYILTVIDILSRQAWAFPLKTKQGDECSETFRKGIIVAAGVVPYRLYTDGGKEFLAQHFQ